MKKILAMAVAALMLAASLASCASSGDSSAIDDYTPENLTATTESGTFTYERGDGDAVILARYEGKKTHGEEVTVPATVELEGTVRRVVGIGKEAFRGLSSITKVTLASSIVTIDAFAFVDCVYLEEVVLEEGSQLAAIGEGAFHKCAALTSMDFSDTKLATISKSAFDSCTALETVAFGDSLTTIGKAAFFDCSALKAVTLPDTVTKIDDLAFFGCTAVETVILSNGLTDMATEALLLTNDTTLADKVDLSKLDTASYAYRYVAKLLGIASESESDTTADAAEA